jgi:hypothetical protein
MDIANVIDRIVADDDFVFAPEFSRDCDEHKKLEKVFLDYYSDSAWVSFPFISRCFGKYIAEYYCP